MEADNSRIESKSAGAVVVDLDEARQIRDELRASTAQSYIDPVKNAAMKFWLILFLAMILLALAAKRRSR